MKVELTDRFCSHIKADRRVDYFDEVTTGLALRVTETGSKSWTYNFTIASRRARLTLGTHPALGLSVARTKAIEARAKSTAGGPKVGCVGGSNKTDCEGGVFATSEAEVIKEAAKQFKVAEALRDRIVARREDY